MNEINHIFVVEGIWIFLFLLTDSLGPFVTLLNLSVLVNNYIIDGINLCQQYYQKFFHSCNLPFDFVLYCKFVAIKANTTEIRDPVVNWKKNRVLKIWKLKLWH